MSLMISFRPRWRWLLAINLLFAVIVAVLCSGIFVWSPLNCWTEEVDINSGRMRYSRYLLYVRIKQIERETWISQAAFKLNDLPQWRMVNTFSPGTRNSPNYMYHSAMGQIRTAEQMDALADFTPAARQKVAIRVLDAWQTGSDAAAESYLQQLSELVFQRLDQKRRLMDASDVP